MNDDFGADLDRYLTTEPEGGYVERCDCPWESGCSVCWPKEIVVPMPTPVES